MSGFHGETCQCEDHSREYINDNLLVDRGDFAAPGRSAAEDEVAANKAGDEGVVRAYYDRTTTISNPIGTLGLQVWYICDIPTLSFARGRAESLSLPHAMNKLTLLPLLGAVMLQYVER